MNYVKVALFAVIGSLVACSTPSPQNIANESAPPKLSKQVVNNSVAPVAIREGQDATNQDSTYVVPTVPNQQTTEQASIAPPGSNLAQMAAPQKTVATPAKTVSSNRGGSVTLKTSYAQAWDKLGKTLPAAGYPVMEQDSGSGTYYILDKVSSGGVIKRDTPIYQVHLEKSGNGTQITVLNSQNQPADGDAAGRILSVVQKN